jgi:microcystin-dependent protein
MTNGSNCVNTSNAGNHTHNSEGNNQPHNNMPPFYVLAYIMKL